MTVKRIRWTAALGVALSLPCLAGADEVVWRPVACTPTTPVVVASTRPQAVTTPTPPPGQPSPAPRPSAASLGRPVPLASPQQALVRQEAREQARPIPTTASSTGSVAPASFVATTQWRAVVRGQAGEGDPLLGGQPPLPPGTSAPPPPTAPLLPPPPPPLPASDPPTSVVSADVPREAETGWNVKPVSAERPVQGSSGFTTHVTAGPPDTVPPPGAGGGLPPAGPFLPPGQYNSGAPVEHPLGTSFWDRCRGWFDFGGPSTCQPRNLFQSDHAFEQQGRFLISPVTAPFFFEDPRALTEVRPIFMFVSGANNNPIFRGGNSYFYGTQARVAFTDRLSVVLNELGFFTLDPKNPVPGVLGQETGFAQMRLGPKYTFSRDPDCGRVAAAGVTFDVPVGSHKVYGDTGNLGLDPYVSYGQTFGRLYGGSFNFVGTAGYDFAVDDQRSEFLHAHAHLSYNVLGANVFFPLVEMNYLYYTKHGHNTDLGFEGADLINFGSRTTAGRSYLSLATGFRYAFDQHFQGGVALEFPVTNEKGLGDFRMTFDLIFRY